MIEASNPVRLHWLIALDRAVLVWAQQAQTPLWTPLMRALTWLGDASTMTVLTGLLVAIPGSRPLGILLGLGAALGAGAAQVLKRVARRPRPTTSLAGFSSLVAAPDAFSFPSGHTSAAFGAAIAVGALGDAPGIVGAMVASLIGVSRVYLGVHYPLDVGAAILVGSACGWIARALWGLA